MKQYHIHRILPGLCFQSESYRDINRALDRARAIAFMDRSKPGAVVGLSSNSYGSLRSRFLTPGELACVFQDHDMRLIRKALRIDDRGYIGELSQQPFNSDTVNEVLVPRRADDKDLVKAIKRLAKQRIRDACRRWLYTSTLKVNK